MTDKSPAMLSVRGVETYYGKIVALRGVDVEVNAGEIVTLIGANISTACLPSRVNAIGWKMATTQRERCSTSEPGSPVSF